MPKTAEPQVDDAPAAPEAPAAPPRKSPAPARAKPTDQSDTKPKKQPPYAVILHNDNINGFDFVVRTLRKVFGYGGFKAFRLTMRAHFAGKAVVWSGMKEHAELKADQLRSCGPDPQMRHKGAQTLRVSIEPQPG